MHNSPTINLIRLGNYFTRRFHTDIVILRISNVASVARSTSVVVRCETLTRTATRTETAHVSLADLAIRRAIGVVGPKKLLFAVLRTGGEAVQEYQTH